MVANVLVILIAMGVPLTADAPPDDCPHFSTCGTPAPGEFGCSLQIKCYCEQEIEAPNECFGGLKIAGTGINERLVFPSKCCAIGFEELCFTPRDCKLAGTLCQNDSECDSDPPTGPDPVFTMSYHPMEGNCDDFDPCGTEGDPD